MTIKFAGIDAIPADCYILNFVVNGNDETIFCQGIEELMSTVLSAEEFDDWLGGEGLPLLNGEKINDEVEYAEKYIDKTADDFCVLFEN
ncbi:hypothetical protein DKZ29_06700 [Limosilactobacillus reuteri]|uniref:Uncharacterized protein n=1 Tax=Limosilactobacillus reuteri TaxID=1598 RepID=A0ABD6Y6Q2_LIMRT|nr:hypothetical protein [Limosilactobacillus reuteri]PWT35297.1 hypothetical protein DKZ24_04375 [Limosilactobacillus reuteri]PWT37524.1 hypothetical protein DKZ35_04730 [Limosilactobacillus reuteri]PWT55739.1 hypothetical protein DKZ31_01215 [Limosilactobacillus reuteri]PWT58089.1 hypothetical protein DKZ29_06700 [Limosilactobacillus reuteri]PWT60008.1 hypothetical protein DKZ30_04295 [Limosilactobacillus reuteri]